MRVQDQLHRAANGLHRGGVERAFGIERGVTGGEQQRIALAQWDVELFGQPQHHVAAGTGASTFDEAEMALGNFGVECEVELAAPALLPPRAQQGADGPPGAGENGIGRGDGRAHAAA